MSDPDILLALKNVIDPELGINVVDLGLVYRADHSATGIEVALTMTTPSCPLGEMIMEEARLALGERFPEAPSINVELVWDPPWSPERMSAEARGQLGLS